jgi:hypothetical protein
VARQGQRGVKPSQEFVLGVGYFAVFCARITDKGREDLGGPPLPVRSFPAAKTSPGFHDIRTCNNLAIRRAGPIHSHHYFGANATTSQQHAGSFEGHHHLSLSLGQECLVLFQPLFSPSRPRIRKKLTLLILSSRL